MRTNVIGVLFSVPKRWKVDISRVSDEQARRRFRFVRNRNRVLFRMDVNGRAIRPGYVPVFGRQKPKSPRTSLYINDSRRHATIVVIERPRNRRLLHYPVPSSLRRSRVPFVFNQTRSFSGSRANIMSSRGAY